MRSSKRLILVGLLSLCACGSSNNGAPAPQDGAGDPATDAGATGEGGTCTTHGGADEPDDQGIDANCDGADGVVGVDVYVSNAGTDTNAGTPAQPLRTIAAALRIATGRGGKVLVSSGAYSVDSIKVPGAWSVFGGYSSNYVGAPKRAATILGSASGGLLIDQASSARLAHLTVRGAAPMDDKHPSALGLISNVDKLALDDVEIDAVDGRDGAPGADGARGDSGAHGGDGNSQTRLVCRGFAQPSFSYGAMAYTPNAEGHRPGDFSSARPAEPGSAGAPGTDGADATGVPALVDGVLVADQGAPGSSNGRPGFGGPGGGGGTTDVQYIGGGGGSGGCPGAGGAGGMSGGASVALLVMRGSVTLTRSNLHTALGGAGGDGGAGGSGGAGGQPGQPTAVPSANLPDPCTSTNDPAQRNCAAYGGKGGAGGDGGHGGGGAGGWTIAVVSAAGADAQIDAATTFDLGRPGSGGTGNGGGRAPNGKSLRAYALP